MEKIAWGIIGCGNVTEVKSGPAFNKVENSSLVAVMRRSRDKAKDYAQRHNVPAFYDDADLLINDPNVNAIYIATPPSSHEKYALAAMASGKHVYVEKPMALNYAEAKRIAAATHANAKLSIAHYRREQPLFKKIKKLLTEKIIGEVLLVSLRYYRNTITAEQLNERGVQWRVNPAISGGGLFHDLAPHQLDLLYYFFGEVESASGKAVNQSGAYPAPDLVAGNILFKSNIYFEGIWNFNSLPGEQKDSIEIIGTKGTIRFSVFQHEIFYITVNNISTSYTFDKIIHVQQPMIEKVVRYFLGKGPNPCSGNDGVKVMDLLDKISQTG